MRGFLDFSTIVVGLHIIVCEVASDVGFKLAGKYAQYGE